MHLQKCFLYDCVIAETSSPSFADGDLDFESLNFDEKFEEEKTDISNENLQTKEDEALQQEAAYQTAVLSDMETKYVNMAENNDEEQSDEEDFKAVGVMSMEKIQEEDYTSSEGDSEQEGSVSGDDEEGEEEDMRAGEKAGDLLMSDGNKEDRIFAEGQPLAPQGAESPQDRNKEHSESNEEVSYFERVPERGGEMVIRGDRIEDEEEEIEEAKQEDSSDSSECEGMKVEQDENVLALRFEEEVDNLSRDGPEKVSLEFPEILVQNLQDLVAEVESEECEEIVEDFSGEEHQEAGESFADYPSDFSSCEYVEESQGSKHQTSNLACTSDGSSVSYQDARLGEEATDRTSMGGGEDTDEEGDEYLYSRNLDEGLDVTGEEDRERLELIEGDAGCDDEGETDESDSCSSSDDEVKRSDEERDIYTDNLGHQFPENNKEYEEAELTSGSSAAFRVEGAGLDLNWDIDRLTTDTLLSEELLTTEDTHRAETLLSDVIAEDVNFYSVVQREDAKTTSSSNQGSLDDSFFFDTELETSGVTEMEQRGEDEYEEERSWDQEKERIKAFYKFYDDSDGEDGREGRQAKVQFCSDPLSRVIHYETDSSDRDSLCSSTEGEEDLSSAETAEVCMWTHTTTHENTHAKHKNASFNCFVFAKELREPENEITEIKPACDPPNTEIPEDLPDLKAAPIPTRNQKCLNMLKLTLKMAVVILMGLVMFWLVTDQAHMFNTGSFF
uniref:aspartic and glutamic acid-rich protein isoform X2 n=1 Tax=Semicossyphus pulcher TaxID=241346 RepID=UPI0037E8E4B4